jgi:hypothetical protein
MPTVRPDGPLDVASNPGRLRGERRLECDLGHAGQGPADRASRLGRLGMLHERGLAETRHIPDRHQCDLGDGWDAVNGSQPDCRIGVHRLGWGARLSKEVRQRHRKAGCVRRRDQLLGAGAWPILEAGLLGVAPLIVSPAVKVPEPVGTSPRHSALAFAGIGTSTWLVCGGLVTVQLRPGRLCSYLSRRGLLGGRF